MSKVEIVSAQENEFEDVGVLVVAAYRDLLGDELSEAYEQELLRVKERSQVSDVLVAKIGETIVGSVTYVWDAHSPISEGLKDFEVGVRMLAVDPKWQGKGIGKSLVDYVIERAKHDKARSIFLYSLEAMKVAHRIYMNLNFERTPSRDYLMDNGRYLLAFTRSL